MISIIDPPIPQKERGVNIGVWLEYEGNDILLKSSDGIVSKIELRISPNRTAYYSGGWTNFKWQELGC